MSGVLTVLLFVLIVGHELHLVASDDHDELSDSDTDPRATPDGDNSPTEFREKSPPESNFGDNGAADESPDKRSNRPTKNYWYQQDSEKSVDTDDEEHERSTPAPRKNIFIYVPFRSSESRSRFRNQSPLETTPATTTTTTTATTPKPLLVIGHPTVRTTFSSAWPPSDSPSLRSISRSSPEYRGLDKWKPVSGLKQSASSSFYTQAAAPLVQSPVVQTRVLQSPTQIPLSAPTLLLAPPQSAPIQVQQQPIHDVRVVEAPQQQQQPVQLSVLQAPAAAAPIQLNLVRSPPQPPAVHVNFVRAQPQTLVQAAPLIEQRLVQAPPVHTHVLQSPVIQAQPVLHAPLLRAPVFHDVPPVLVPAAPPCPTPLFATRLHAPPHTFFSPPVAQRTRTVLQQVQFVPDHTHVFTTTSFSPATRTTIYESDHVAAFSSPKGHYVSAPHAVPRSPASALYADRQAGATIYTFPKMRILGAPFRIAGRLSSRRLLRQRLREERRKEKQQKEKEKKILVFNSRNSD